MILFIAVPHGGDRQTTPSSPLVCRLHLRQGCTTAFPLSVIGFPHEHGLAGFLGNLLGFGHGGGSGNHKSRSSVASM